MPTPNRRTSWRGLEPMSVSRSRAATQTRVDALVEQAQPRQPREQVAPEQPLRQRGLARADGKVHGVRRRQLLGDLKAGVAATDHEDRAVGHAARAAIGGAVHLEQRRVQLVGERRHARDVERPGSDNDLVGRDAAAVRQLEDEAVVPGLQRPHPAAKPDGQVERPRVVLEVGHHLVAAGIAVGVAGERQAGKRVVAARREQDQRVPAIAPRRGDVLAGLEDHEPASGAREEVANRQPGLAGADDGNLDARLGRVHREVLLR
jgi:hypothetical protein